MQFLIKSFFIMLCGLFSYTHSYEITIVSVSNLHEEVWLQLKEVFLDSFAEAYKQRDTRSSIMASLQKLFEDDRKAISDLNFQFILAAENKEVLGYILCCYCTEIKKAYVHHLVVNTHKQGKGIGKALLKACEDLYKEANYIALGTRKFNLDAIAFYKHIGFYETDCGLDIFYSVRPFAKNNSEVLLLEKQINKKM